MKRAVLTLLGLSSAACFNFDAAYDTYCKNAHCDAGSAAGGSSGGGSAGGGSTGGGTSAGGASGGGASGGSTGGGVVAGGSAGGGSAGGMTDAGVMCGQPFCLHRATTRAGNLYFGDGVVGSSLNEAFGFFTRSATPAAVHIVEHDPNGMGTGLTRPAPSAVPFVKVSGPSAKDFFMISNSNVISAPVYHFVDGGLAGTVFRSGSTGCAGQDWFANSLSFDAVQNRLLVGGRNEGICSVNLAASNATTVLQPDTMAGSQYVDAVFASPGGSVFYGTDDGYVGKVGVGRISAQLDPEGIRGIDGTSESNIWMVSQQCRVFAPAADGGIDLIADLSGLTSTCYSIAVTTNAVYIGAFEGILHRTRFTDGGFEFFQNLPTGAIPRFFNISAGPEAVHVVGDEGPASSPSQAFFYTLIPRTQ